MEAQQELSRSAPHTRPGVVLHEEHEHENEQEYQQADQLPPMPSPAATAVPFRPGLKVDAESAATVMLEDDGELYGDQDNAQSIMLPSISPVATRLTSPRTPAAEKAAAMDKMMDSFFDQGFPEDLRTAQQPTISSVIFTSETVPASPAKEEGLDLAGSARPKYSSSSSSPTGETTTFPQLHVTQHDGPSTTFAAAAAGVGPSSSKQTALSGVFGSETRHRRSASVGTEALKRLSKALPSISLPSGIFPSISTPSFFSSSTSSSTAKALSSHAETFSGAARPSSRHATQTTATTVTTTTTTTATTADGTIPRPPSVAPSVLSVQQTYQLRRSTSADSLLYNSLSRVSSFGDDDRFENIREQVNSRFKAIMDSFDRPTFKMPQFPNIIPAPLKKSSSSGPGDAGFYARSADGPSSSGPSAATATTTATAPQPQPQPQPPPPSRDGAAMLDAVLETLTGDVVIMGGYRGSVLRSAEPPHRQLWVPVKVGLNIRKVDLAVGLEPEDEEIMRGRIFASGMLQHIGPVDISRRLFKRMRECPASRAGRLRVHEFAYDWRLSPARSSRQLVRFLEALSSNRRRGDGSGSGGGKDDNGGGGGALVLAHSLGGLITRHAVNQRPDLFSGVVYVGTPQRCINVLGPLRNGDAVLLNEKVLTAAVNFSFRTSFVFLPEDGFCFISKDGRESYPVDFHNPDDWVRYGLCPSCLDPPTGGGPKRNSSTLGSLLENSLSSLPLRGRSASDAKGRGGAGAGGAGAGKGEFTKDRTLAFQMDSSSAANTNTNTNTNSNTNSNDNAPSSKPASGSTSPDLAASTAPSSPPPESSSFACAPAAAPTPAPADDQRARALAYLTRTLAETARFRAETRHDPSHSAGNRYPPLAVIYGKDTPTVYAARVSSREAIGRPDMYDDLVFRSGDGVVLAREAMPPPGYDVVRGGRVSTEKGHVSMLGDFAAVARAVEAVLRGRRKGIGLGGAGVAKGGVIGEVGVL